MFGWFRRKPSAYAVAIRDSMTNEPERWKYELFAENDEDTEWIRHDSRVCVNATNNDLAGVNCPRRDRRVIREGIESWIAWSVRKQEPTDAQT